MDADRSDLAELLGIGHMLTEERVQRGLSQSDLARASGVAQSTISRIEAGESVPSWRLVTDLLAALGLQPVIAAQPRWRDVDAAAERLRGLSLEQRCADMESWLLEIADAVAPSSGPRSIILGQLNDPVPIALRGASAARLQRLPVVPRRIELVTSAEPAAVAQVVRWARAQQMRVLDPLSLRPVDVAPEASTVLDWGQLRARWEGRLLHLTVEPSFRLDDAVWVRVFGVAVPVVRLADLVGSDPWMRRVLRRRQET